MMVDAGSIRRLIIDLIQKPNTTKSAIAPVHHRNGVPIARTSCEHDGPPHVFGDS